MKRVKKLLAVLLSMSFLLALATGGVEAAAAGQYSTKTFKNAKRYTFKHNEGHDKDYKGVMYYTDDYFTLSSTASQPNISFMAASYCIAMSAMNSNDAKTPADNDQNLRNLFKKLGYTNYTPHEEYVKKSTPDSIGFGAASKKIPGKDYTVVAVGLRGKGYSAEWAGNFSLGRYGQHKGFAVNKDKLIDFLKNYIETNHITGHVKLWLCGYSRGGAVANLAAAAIDDGALSGLNIKMGKSDLYAMCFEPPQGAMVSDDLQNARYNNIWCFINPADLIPRVAMKEYGFGVYGRTWKYPSKGTTSNYSTKQKAMEKLYYAQTASAEVGDYSADSFQMYQFDLTDGVISKDKDNKMTLAEFDDELLRIVALDLVGSRENFVNEYQNGFRTVLSVIMGRELLTGQETNVNGFVKNLQRNLKDESLEARLARAAAKPYDATFGFNTVLKDLVTETLNDTGINSLSPTALTSFVTMTVKLLAGLFIYNPDYAVTAILNITKIINAHFPEVSFSWLMSLDPNYNGTADCL